MSESFELESVEGFTAGTVGEPGSRAFFLQLTALGRVLAFRLEKQQVGALAEVLAERLVDLPPVELATLDMALVEPVVPEWVVGPIGVTYDADDDVVAILLREAVVEEDDEPAAARFNLTRSQAAAFAGHASELVAAGRPPCRLCGGPLDPAGHICPRANGHRPRP